MKKLKGDRLIFLNKNSGSLKEIKSKSPLVYLSLISIGINFVLYLWDNIKN